MHMGVSLLALRLLGGGINFWSREFGGFLLEGLGIFWGFDFCPSLIIPVN